MAWCHADVETTNRRPRVDQLILPGNVATIGDWLEVLVTDPTVDGASAAIRAAAAVFPDAPLKRRREIASGRIVLCSDGSVAAPNAVLISLPGRPRSPRNKYVDQALVDNAETHRALVEIGVRESDAVGDLRTFLARLRKEPRDDEWRTLWDLAGHVSAGDFVEALHANGFDDGRISALRWPVTSARSARSCSPGRSLTAWATMTPRSRSTRGSTVPPRCTFVAWGSLTARQRPVAHPPRHGLPPIRGGRRAPT